MLKSLLLPPTALTALCLAFTACQTTQPHQLDRFDQADANRDGVLSRDEVNTYIVSRVFHSRDMDKNGSVTKTEWLAGEDAGQEKIFRDRDANKDGAVTIEEATAYGRKHGMANQLMQKADKDGNGVLSRAEITAYYGSKEGPPR